MAYPIEEKLIRINEHTRPGTKLKGVKGIVIHWTANEEKGADRFAHFNFFNKGEVYASAHYFVDSEGILRIIPENEMAYHVGAKTYKTDRFGSYPNHYMIGVEMCVNPDGDFKETYKRAVWLCADLLRRYKLDPDKDLVRHYDITGKDCPRMFVDDACAKKYMGMSAAAAYAKFKNDVKALLNPTAPKAVVKPPQPVKSDNSTGKSVKSKVNGLRFYSKPSWDDKDVAGVCNKGMGFPKILGKVLVEGAYQYKVANSKGDVFYVTASDKYVEVE
jgi:N-acetylmuramoyl-L-alanine amidase